MTQTRLAEAINVTTAMVCRYEKGRVNPSEAVWRRLIGVLGEPARELWFAQGDLTPAESAEYRRHDV
jgi:DNA-binding XRE family transcriptional regulator